MKYEIMKFHVNRMLNVGCFGQCIVLRVHAALIKIVVFVFDISVDLDYRVEHCAMVIYTTAEQQLQLYDIRDNQIYPKAAYLQTRKKCM